MKTGNIVQEKSFAFALRIVGFTRMMQQVAKEFVLSKQLLRSGTAVGALIEEAIGGQSTRDFLSKFSIAYKEARETKYWLRLILSDLELRITNDELLPLSQRSWRPILTELITEIEELLRIIGSIQISLKKKLSEDPPKS